MDNDAAAWKLMEKYNKQDVILLEKLYDRLLPWIDGHPNHGLYEESDTMVCTNCGSKHLQRRGLQHSLTASYQRYQCQDCGTWMRGRYTMLDKDKSGLILAGV
jgi:DNA-directed RNA polymerase subunit RPC12/RpoP